MNDQIAKAFLAVLSVPLPPRHVVVDDLTVNLVRITCECINKTTAADFECKLCFGLKQRLVMATVPKPKKRRKRK